MKRVINLADVNIKPRPQSFSATSDTAQRFDAARGEIGREIGATRLGYNLTIVPAGKSAFPFHNHHVN